MTTPASAIDPIPGERRDRTLIKGLLAHLARVRDQRWTSLDFPDERIRSRAAVQVIAMEETGRATAVEHVSMDQLAADDEVTQRWLAAVVPLEQDRALQIPAFHVDVMVRLGVVPTGVAEQLVVGALQGWCARHLRTTPEGESSHVFTVAGTPMRLQVDKTRCPGQPGGLSILRAELPRNFEVVVQNRLQRQLGTLVSASADRYVLLFEKSNGLWTVSQLRTELAASLDFPDLNRVHEIWTVDTRGWSTDDALVYRRVIPPPG
jgi:hypothetical protein